MDQGTEASGLQPNAALPPRTKYDDGRGLMITTQSGCAACGAPGGAAPSAPDGRGVPAYIYAIGRIEARFPNLAAEKEFAQAIARTDTAGKTDQQTFHAVLSRPENRYLARQVCWVLSIQGLETYLLLARDAADMFMLIESIRAEPNANDLDVVIGMRGAIAPPALCNGLMVPIVIFDQIYSFDQAALIKAIPKPDQTSAAHFAPSAEEIFNRVIQLTDNAGATDEHRALNYLAMRYPAIYARAFEAFASDFSLSGVDVRSAPLNGTRKLVDVVFAYTNRKTDFTEKVFVRVDVTEEFPFLVKKLTPFYDRSN